MEDTIRVIFCGRKPYSVSALSYILELGWEVQLVIIPNANEPAWMPKPHLEDFAREQKIPVDHLEHINHFLEGSQSFYPYLNLADTDYLISYLFPHLITKPLLTHAKSGAINFHPGPLPEFAGFRGYNFAILEDSNYYGCTCHFMDDQFDTGDVIKTRQFYINPKRETALNLERRTQEEMLLLFREICDMVNDSHELPRTPQAETKYLTRQDFEEARCISPGDSAESIEKRIRAFFYPPYKGATIIVEGEQYTLVSDDLLEMIGYRIHQPVVGQAFKK